MNKQNVLNKIAHINTLCEKRGINKVFILHRRNGYYYLELENDNESSRAYISGTLNEVGLYLAGMIEGLGMV